MEREDIVPIIRKANWTLLAFGVVVLCTLIFIALPLWLHWMDVIMKFWGIRGVAYSQITGERHRPFESIGLQPGDCLRVTSAETLVKVDCSCKETR
jgi:hypothetical protein